MKEKGGGKSKYMFNFTSFSFAYKVPEKKNSTHEMYIT
jgi:hypothetical protein